MKKIVYLLMPLIALSLLANCGNSKANRDGALTFTCNKDGGSLKLIHSQIKRHKTNLSWQKNNEKIVSKTIDNDELYTVIDLATDLKKGDKIKIFGDNPNGFSSNAYDDDSIFLNEFATGKEDDFILSGNIMSLIKSSNFNDLSKIPENGCFRELFSNDDSLDIYCRISDASNFLLPATELSKASYADMFYASSILVKSPQLLPAETLSDECYVNMFKCNSALISAPKINAKTLAKHCCDSMFSTCSSLVLPPKVNFTNAKPAPFCFALMFHCCDKLKKGITISDEGPLQDTCYYYMFASCSSLEVTTTASQKTTKIFKCPSLTNNDIGPLDEMFFGTKGGITTPTPGETYYYVND